MTKNKLALAAGGIGVLALIAAVVRCVLDALGR